MVRVMANFQKSLRQRRPSQTAAAVPPSLWWAPADPHLPWRPSNTSRSFQISFLWSHCSFPLRLGVCKVLFVPSKTGVCFPQSCGSLVIKSCWPSRSDSLGIPSPFVESPGWEAWQWGLEPSQRWKNFFGIIVLQFVGHPPSRYGARCCCNCAPPTVSLLSLWTWSIFFSGPQRPPVNGCSTASCDFGALAGDECTPSTPPSWTPPYCLLIEIFVLYIV